MNHMKILLAYLGRLSPEHLQRIVDVMKLCEYASLHLPMSAYAEATLRLAVERSIEDLADHEIQLLEQLIQSEASR